jgi:hypothetical protein
MDDVMSPSSIKKLLQANDSALQRIYAKVQLLEQLNAIFVEQIEARFRKKCIVANFNNDKLIVLAQNAAIATQFRFTIPDLLPRLQQSSILKNIKGIECKVAV